MANFQVPQFIEIEDKIFGPLTFRQFVYLAGGAGICFLFWVYIPFHLIALLFIVPLAAFSLALTFWKVNNRPFILIAEATFKYLFTKKLYIWKRSATPTAPTPSVAEVQPGTPGTLEGLKIPKLSSSKLKDLAWSLDVQEKIR
jgi:hypothetical protein